ncbi:MAG: hypothetical protein H0X46_08540, partial [Bacteroidetes bacterium]|nr:hypothetical protein [Bacteroidota bacterium]
LYIDNHAWNAVRLDNYWYVYDVTWSAGRYHLEFRRFGKWISKVQKKLYKTKIGSVTFRSRHKAKCDKTRGKYIVAYEILPWWRYRIIRFLSRIPLRVRWVMDKNKNNDFYLINPEVMAVTHMPNDPRWSLTGNYSGIRAFEVDPKYYHLKDTLYKRQVRTGRHCGECDNWFALDDLAKEKQMKHNTSEFNPRNHFAPFNADYNIANILYNRSLPLEDSTAKIQHIDSALSYYDRARDDLRKASRDVTTENRLLRAKNAKKVKLLLDENKGYESFIHALLTTTNASTGAMKKFIGRARVTELRIKAAQDKLPYLSVKTPPYNNKDNVIKMQDLFVKKMSIVDSVSKFIAASRVQYSSMLQQLAENMYSKDSVLDSMAAPFSRGGIYRLYFRQDNYKKLIAEDRKTIPLRKELYAADIKTSICQLSASVAKLGMQIFLAFDKRDRYILESGRLLNVIVNEGMVNKDSLNRHRTYYDAVMQENICWLTMSSSQLSAVTEGYRRMLKRQRLMEEVIRWENRAERNRYRAINGQITWRKKKFGSIPPNNLRVCVRKKNVVKKYKRDYLKKLKDARRKERDEAKKKKKGW